MEYSEIKKLMDDMGDSKLTELEIEFPDGIATTSSNGSTTGSSTYEYSSNSRFC